MNEEARARAIAIIEETHAELRKRHAAPDCKRPRILKQSEEREWEIARYSEAIQADPTYAPAYVHRGSSLYFEGRRQEAATDMTKALALKPDDPHLYFMIANPFRGKEQRRILQTGIDLAGPDSSQGRFLQASLIRSYWYEKNYKMQTRLLEEFILKLERSGTTDGLAYSELAWGYSALGKYDQAEAALRKIVDKVDAKHYRRIVVSIIQTLMHREKYDEARQAVLEFQDRMKPEAFVVWNAALAALSAPEEAESKRCCEDALTDAKWLGLAPGPIERNTNVYSFHLGVIYGCIGRREDARRVLLLYAEECSANKLEWAVTCKWEIAKARELARRFA